MIQSTSKNAADRALFSEDLKDIFFSFFELCDYVDETLAANMSKESQAYAALLQTTHQLQQGHFGNYIEKDGTSSVWPMLENWFTYLLVTSGQVSKVFLQIHSDAANLILQVTNKKMVSATNSGRSHRLLLWSQIQTFRNHSQTGVCRSRRVDDFIQKICVDDAATRCSIWSSQMPLGARLGDILCTLERDDYADVALAIGDPCPEKQKTIVLKSCVFYKQHTTGGLHPKDERTLPHRAHTTSVWETFLDFLDCAQQTEQTRSNCNVVLLHGASGSGKTYVCNEMKTNALAQSVQVRNVCLQTDIVRSYVGESEDALLSSLSFLQCPKGSLLILLDDFDRLLDASGQKITESHLFRRCQSLFTALTENLNRRNNLCSNVLVICTSSRNNVAELFRFSKCFSLELPNRRSRRAVITSYLKWNAIGLENKESERLTSEIVDLTVGKSYSKIAMLCRKSVAATCATSLDPSVSHDSVLCCLRDRLQVAIPESLSDSVLLDTVDIRVRTGRELISSTEIIPKFGGYRLPMRGKSAHAAWKALTSSIILPLCQARELTMLLNALHSDKHASIVGGILLVGEPGTGKREISIHCATFAATLLPSISCINVTCTSLVHKEVGESERAIHLLFKSAREAAPCILLMNGIDDIAGVRGNDSTSEGTMDRILSTLLIELDGVEDHIGCDSFSAGVAVIGISRTASGIDPALLRPGRLERVVELLHDW